jgi:hypothetical protein
MRTEYSGSVHSPERNLAEALLHGEEPILLDAYTLAHTMVCVKCSADFVEAFAHNRPGQYRHATPPTTAEHNTRKFRQYDGAFSFSCSHFSRYIGEFRFRKGKVVKISLDRFLNPCKNVAVG